MANKYISKFKNKTTGEEYEIYAASARTSTSAQNAEHAYTADSVNAIGKVEKYSGVYNGKQREGLKIVNNAYNGENPNYSLIEMNSKGNLSIESLAKHVNIEAKSGVQIKPTTNIIFDSSRRILANKGNEVQIEAKFDDYSNFNKGEAPEYENHDGVEDEFAELKINSRNIDLRCNKHGGIALQIAGCDHYYNPSETHHENKIKFESDRQTPLTDNYTAVPGNYQGEGGKGLEFGTFNNEHASLYTHDYRFRGQGTVFGVERESPTLVNGKYDYPTQEDDFKDVITNATPKATWNEIIDAANKCKGKESIASENFVTTKIAEAQMSGGSSSLEGYATEEWVQNYVSTACPAPDLSNYYTKSETETVSSYVNSVVFPKSKNNNVEISSVGKTQGPDCDEPNIIGYSVGDEVFETIEEANAYIAEHGGELVTIYEKSSLDLVSDGKIAVKATKDFEIGGKDISIPIEISKKNKYSCGGYEVTVNSLAELESVMPKLKISVEKNNSTISGIAANYPVGEISVSIVDLINLVSRVNELEARVAALEPRPTYTITAEANPSQFGSVTGGGEYEEGTIVTLEALPVSGHVFEGWDDGETANQRQITVDGDATYVANFGMQA